MLRDVDGTDDYATDDWTDGRTTGRTRRNGRTIRGIILVTFGCLWKSFGCLADFWFQFGHLLASTTYLRMHVMPASIMFWDGACSICFFLTFAWICWNAQTLSKMTMFRFVWTAVWVFPPKQKGPVLKGLKKGQKKSGVCVRKKNLFFVIFLGGGREPVGSPAGTSRHACLSTLFVRYSKNWLRRTN